MQDDLEQMKKKNTKLSQRFDSLRDQINARILDDHYQKKGEVANSHYFSHQLPIKNLAVDVNNKQGERALTMIQRNFMGNKDGVYQKLQLQGKSGPQKMQPLREMWI